MEKELSGQREHQAEAPAVGKWRRPSGLEQRRREESREAAGATARGCQGPGLGKVGRATHNELQMGPVRNIYLAVCLMHIENYIL